MHPLGQKCKCEPLSSLCQENQSLADLVQQCGGSVSVRGAIHSKVFLQGSKPKSKLAEKVTFNSYFSITHFNTFYI